MRQFCLSIFGKFHVLQGKLHFKEETREEGKAECSRQETDGGEGEERGKRERKKERKSLPVMLGMVPAKSKKHAFPRDGLDLLSSKVSFWLLLLQNTTTS